MALSESRKVAKYSAVILAIFLISSASTKASQEPQPGNIIRRVVCKSTPDQSYALYLPSSYSPARKWPLLAAFDPGARGNVPVERFKQAAEQYGYIVCGSNNSRNGPMSASADAAQAMLIDVFARFSIDEKRVYLTGFSGGARAATTIAVFLKEKVAGVIGCGAGLAVGIEPSSSLPFVYYGTVGDEDFNYPEMKQLDRALGSAGVAHRIEVFEGGHGWAPAELCQRAIEWMELQAMKSARRSRDDSFIDRLLKIAQDTAGASESSGHIYDAYLAYAQIAADFAGLRDISASERKAAQLKDSKAVKQALAKDRDQDAEQRRRLTEMFELRANAQKWTSDPQTQRPFLIDLKQLISDLKKKSEAKENSTERAIARRILSQYTIASFEQSTSLIQSKKYHLAVANLALESELMPDNWRVLYNLSCAYALNGDKRRAVETLNRAVQKGFTNAEELERNSQLDGIREEAGFKKIVEELRHKK